MDPRGDRRWAEWAKDAAQELNQSASPSNPASGDVYQQEGAVQGAAFSPGGLHERKAAEQSGG